MANFMTDKALIQKAITQINALKEAPRSAQWAIAYNMASEVAFSCKETGDGGQMEYEISTQYKPDGDMGYRRLAMGMESYGRNRKYKTKAEAWADMKKKIVTFLRAAM